jgi:hypothetical protein
MTIATSNQVTVTLQLTAEREQQLRERAAARGVSVAEYVQQLIEREVASPPEQPNGQQPAPSEGPPKRYQRVRLGGTTYLFEDPRPYPHPMPSPRGLLPTPPIVEEEVAEHVRRYPMMNAEAKQRLTDDLNLQYYFEGMEVAYRHTERGVEVLAVGFPEIRELLDKLSPEEKLKVTLGQP